MTMAFYLAMAGLPSFLLLRYFYKRDNLKPEPTNQVIRIFFMGCLMILPAIILEKLISYFMPLVDRQWHALYQAFAVAALVEEGIKFVLIKRVSRRMASFDEITDGIVYTIAAGLGFAFFENVAYGLRAGGFGILLLRGFTAVPLHAIASGLMGYYVGEAWFNPRRSGLTGLFLAILFHGFYDYILFEPQINDWWILGLLPFGAIWVLQLLKRAQRRDQAEGLS